MSGSSKLRAGLVVDIGVDCVVVDRVLAILERRPGFLNRVLCPEEQERLASITHPQVRAASLAARIAAKEAVMKSLGGGISDLGFLSIEVLGGRRVPPTIELHGAAKERAQSHGVDEIKVSLTHTDELAMATATALRWCECNPS